MSPRKSSTSSGNSFARPRYLLVEVAGAGTPSPRSLEALLDERSLRPPGPPLRFRLIRSEGTHGLVAVSHTDAPEARRLWNSPAVPGRPMLRTLRMFGTLRKGKLWLAARYRSWAGLRAASSGAAHPAAPDRPREGAAPRR